MQIPLRNSKVYVISSEWQIALASAPKCSARDPGSGNGVHLKCLRGQREKQAPWLRKSSTVYCPMATANKGGQMSKRLPQFEGFSQLHKLRKLLTDCLLQASRDYTDKNDMINTNCTRSPLSSNCT